MKFYLKLLITLIPLTLTLVFSRLVYKQDKDTEKKSVLKFPLLYRIVPLLVFCVTIILSVYILLFQFEDWPYIIVLIGVVGLPFMITFIMWSLWRIDIKDDGFMYRNFFGRKIEYQYEDLEYQMHPKGLKWYFYKGDKKVLCMAYYIEGGDILEKQYRKRKRLQCR